MIEQPKQKIAELHLPQPGRGVRRTHIAATQGNRAHNDAQTAH